MEPLSLYQLQHQIARCLQEGLAESYWITAEISELKLNASGHCYLELVEKNEKNALPKAKANAVIWSYRFGMIDSYFRQSTGSALRSGLKILVCVKVNFHELYSLSLVIENIDPTYTLGDMERQRQQTIARLKADGVFELNKELAPTGVFQRIAVISSETAAGYRDFINELRSNGSNYRIDTTLFGALMQGESAERSIIEALIDIEQRQAEFDAVAIIRGGGAVSDLSCFDSYDLCSYIAQFPIPIITGIGHDKDVSIADEVAFMALKTPTAVAKYLIEQCAHTASLLDELEMLLEQSAKGAIRRYRQRIEQHASQLKHLAVNRFRREETRISDQRSALSLRTNKQLWEQSRRTAQLQQQLKQRCISLIANQYHRIDRLGLEVRAGDPQRLLERGFALVFSETGRTVSAANIRPGNRLRIVVRDGEIDAMAEKITTK